MRQIKVLNGCLSHYQYSRFILVNKCLRSDEAGRDVSMGIF